MSISFWILFLLCGVLTGLVHYLARKLYECQALLEKARVLLDAQDKVLRLAYEVIDNLPEDFPR